MARKFTKLMSTTPEPILQEKTATENGEIVPDEGYDGLSKVNVMVQAVSFYGEYTNL